MKLMLAMALVAAGLRAQHAEVRPETLANGIKILIQEDHSIPNVALYLFYRIGSRNEKPGTTGVSHFFEHMMFNGAKKYGPKQFDNEMEKSGGNNNAYTTEDVTVYMDWFPGTALELMFDMEADRMHDLAFDPKIIESERGVVYSERRTSVDNSNSGVLYEQLRASAYTAHPYQWPVVGWPSDIESWTIDDLRAHYKTGYAPNNCVMVVVGDVAADNVMALARKYLEPIASQAPPPPVRTKEPEQVGERRLVVRKPAQLPLQMIAYHVPEAMNKDEAVLDVIDALMTSGESSRLYRRMVDQEQLALEVNASAEHTLDPGLYTFTITPRNGVDPARTEKVLYEEIEKLRNTLAAEPELRKAKNQLLAQHNRSLQTISGRANLLGTYEVFYGDYRKLYSAEQDIEAVTAGDIQRVANKYFGEKNRTVATLIPEAGK